MTSNHESEDIKSSEVKNIQKLREEFNQTQSWNEHYPKTSHGYKHPMNFSNTNTSNRKQRSRYNKALSANKYNQKLTINNNNELNDKIIYDFCKKHPGYLYYKEIITNKKKRNFMNKTRALTGNIINRKMKLEPLSKIGSKNLTKKSSKNDYFPKISKSNSHIKNSIISKQTYYNHNYNYNENTYDKYNPYSIYWANRILNRSDFRIEIRGMAYGVPKLGSANRKDDFLLKILNNNNLSNESNGAKKLHNNFINKPIKKNSKKSKITNSFLIDKKNAKIKNYNKCYKIKNDNNEKKNNSNDENNTGKIIQDNNNKNNGLEENEFENESYDEEQQKQFYTNQRNFFKARKDIIEEPEYLEEDNEANEKVENEKK